MKKILIGIDPGTNTGIAVLQDKNLALKCCNFWEAISFLETVIDHAKSEDIPLKVYLEDPNKNKPVFESKADKLNRKAFGRKAQNVGSNKRDAQLIKEFFESKGVEPILCKPTKYSNTKLEADIFKKITGYPGRTNSHMRDSAMLIWGRQ